MTDEGKLTAILANLKEFEKKFKAGGLSGEDKAEFSKIVAELEAELTVDTADVEVPRLVKKAGEDPKRVNTKEELDAALADGWVLRLPVAEPEPSDDAPAGITSVNADKAKELVAAAASFDALDALEAEEQANTPQPRVSVLKAIDKRRGELDG